MDRDSAPWHETMFGPEYLRHHEARVAAADTAREARLITRLLGWPPPARILDVGCGQGRHALALARRGYKVVGVDRSRFLLETARRRARAESPQAAANLEFIEGDMRSLDECLAGRSPFNGILCWYATFGYFSDADNDAVLRDFRRLLRPGGRLLLDVLNRDGLPLERRRSWDEMDGLLCLDEEEFDAAGGRLTLRRTYLYLDPPDDGPRPRTCEARFRVYTPSELDCMLRAAGFAAESVFGDYDGNPVDSGSERIIVTAGRADG